MNQRSPSLPPNLTANAHVQWKICCIPFIIIQFWFVHCYNVVGTFLIFVFFFTRTIFQISILFSASVFDCSRKIGREDFCINWSAAPVIFISSASTSNLYSSVVQHKFSFNYLKTILQNNTTKLHHEILRSCFELCCYLQCCCKFNCKSKLFHECDFFFSAGMWYLINYFVILLGCYRWTTSNRW